MRKSTAKKRIIAPDPKFRDPLVTQFVNNLMYDGKKSLAYRIFYDALDLIEEKLNKNNEDEPIQGLDVFHNALKNVTPAVEVRSRRVGGATFQVPTEVRPGRKMTLAIKWVIRYARTRNEKTMKERLCNELIAASKNEGGAIKKKEDIHRMADANKAFSHFRF